MAISKEIYEFLTLPLIEDIRKLNPKTFKIKHYNDMSFVYVHGYRPIKFSFLL
jgi:hypothetical protein